jgi:hypothetical protein
MIKADKVAELLKKQLELMETLKGRDLGGFALVCPPDGEPVEIVLMTSHSDPASFFRQVAEKCGATAKQLGEQFTGAVRMGR